MEQSHSWEANQETLQLVKRFPAFMEPESPSPYPQVPTTSPYHWANSIQSPRPPPTSWRFILILSSYLRLGLPNGLFPSGFPTNTLCTHLSSPISATCPAHLIRLYFTTRIILGKEYRSFSSSLCSFRHSPVTSSLLGPNTLLNTVFSNTLSMRSFLNATAWYSSPVAPSLPCCFQYISSYCWMNVFLFIPKFFVYIVFVILSQSVLHASDW